MIAVLKIRWGLVLLTLFQYAAAQNFTASYLGIDQGLSNNSVVSIYQDHRGFMWFGTYDGLNRYNGYEFEVFRNNMEDTNSLLSNTIYTVNGDYQHNIWVGGQKGGCFYNPVTAAFSPLLYKALNNNTAQPLLDIVHQIKPAGKTAMLVGSQSQGLLLYQNGPGTGLQVALSAQKHLVTSYDVIAIAEKDDSPDSWVFVRQFGLCKFSITTKTLQLTDSKIKQVNCMTIDRGGKLWLGTDDGLYSYDFLAKTTSVNYLPTSVKVTHISTSRSGTLWIGTDGEGIFTLAEGTARALPYTANTAQAELKSNAVWSIFEDNGGRHWIGTLRGGISMLDPLPKVFNHIIYKPQNSISKPEQNFILSFCEDEKKNLWIGTDGAGLRYWNTATNSFTNYVRTPGSTGTLSSNFITYITKDSFKDVWVSTWFGGINRLNTRNGLFKHYVCNNPLTGQNEDNTWLIFEDKNKTLWASTTNPGHFYRFNRKTDQFELFDAGITDLQSICETADGQLWGGNYSDLFRIDRSDKKHQVFKIGYPVRCIFEDSDHNFWLGTQEGGLILFDRNTGRTTRYTTINGLPSNTIFRMMQDDKGRIWMSTYNGLSCFTPTLKTFRNFSVSDGLQSTQFSYNAGLRLQSGAFLFGGINGFDMFYPNSIKDEKQPFDLLLSGITINNVPVEKKGNYVMERNSEIIKSIRLPYDEATLSLDFLNLNYSSTDKITYSYFLEGWDKKWNFTGTSRRANYSRLHEGTYTFMVKATNNSGMWSQPYTLLKIVVLPPLYRTWWAYLFYILTAATIIYIYLRYTRKQHRLQYEIRLAQMEKQKEKELAERQLSMFTDISHEFRTPLSLIIDPLKKAVNRKNNDADASNVELLTAHRNARRLLGLVNQLLLFRKVDSGADTLNVSSFDIIFLCDEVYQYFSQQAKSKNINFTFQHSSSSIMLYGDYEKLEIALFNLVSNAFKFTPEHGSVQLIVTEDDTAVKIQVIDTGCGIESADSKRIFEKFEQVKSQLVQRSGFGIGLYLVKSFVEKHGGKVSCESEKGEGATFTVILDKGKAHLKSEHFVEKTIKNSELVEELLPIDDAQTITAENAGLKGAAKAEELVTERKSVLVVDDNEDIRNYLQRVFAPNYLVFTAINAVEAFRLVEQNNPDIVISDISMGPDSMNGVELCKRIKESESFMHIPVILLTAANNPEMKMQGISGGADDYVTKPFDSELLLARVDTLLKSRNQLRKYFLDNITLRENTQKVPAEYQDFLKRCIEVIESNLDKDEFPAKAFARAMGMSHSVLYTKIKAISGQTLNAFIRSIRLRRAAVLMLTENRNVAQASFEVGFEDARYFREQFIKLFGMTPSEYIKKYRHAFNKDLNIIPKNT